MIKYRQFHAQYLNRQLQDQGTTAQSVDRVGGEGRAEYGSDHTVRTRVRLCVRVSVCVSECNTKLSNVSIALGFYFLFCFTY